MSEKPPVFNSATELGPESSEYIVTAALLYDGKVFEGSNHGDAFTTLETSIPKWEGEDHEYPIEIRYQPREIC